MTWARRTDGAGRAEGSGHAKSFALGAAFAVAAAGAGWLAVAELAVLFGAIRAGAPRVMVWTGARSVFCPHRSPSVPWPRCCGVRVRVTKHRTGRSTGSSTWYSTTCRQWRRCRSCCWREAGSSSRSEATSAAAIPASACVPSPSRGIAARPGLARADRGGDRTRSARAREGVRMPHGSGATSVRRVASRSPCRGVPGILLVAALLAAEVDAAAAEGGAVCRLQGWSDDPGGLRVRAAPDPGGARAVRWMGAAATGSPSRWRGAAAGCRSSAPARSPAARRGRRAPFPAPRRAAPSG